MSRQRLFTGRRLRISAPMHILPLLAAAVFAAPLVAAAVSPAVQAQPRQATVPAAAAAKPDGPKSIGTFQDWQAATYTEGGQPVCYAFTRPKQSGTVAGRGEVNLTVTHRPAMRDAVSISPGFAYAANAEVKVALGATTLDFYTAQRSAFARSGAAAVAAFAKAPQAVAKSPGPRGEVSDSFSMKGFSAAYAAINKACPPK